MLPVALVCLTLAGGIIFFVGKVRCQQTAVLILSLRQGARAVTRLDSLLARARFHLPEGRQEVLQALARIVAEEEVEAGLVILGNPRANPEEVGQAAERLWRGQMRVARLSPRWAVNPRRLVEARAAQPMRAGDCCVVTVVTAVGGFHGVRKGARREALAALVRLGGLADVEALYVCYSPDPGQRLPAAAADALFERLRCQAQPNAPLLRTPT